MSGEQSAVPLTGRQHFSPREGAYRLGYAGGMVERRTQEQRSSESRRRLIDAAIRLLAERGYAGTSLAAIGAEAGLSRGLVSHHFGTKEACMQAVVEQIRENMREQSLSAASGHSMSLDDAIDAYFMGVRRQYPAARAMYVVLIEGLTSSPGLGPAVAETSRATREELVNLLAGQVPGESASPAGPEAEALAVVILGILRGVALEYLADPHLVDLEAAARLAKAMINDTVRAARSLA